MSQSVSSKEQKLNVLFLRKKRFCTFLSAFLALVVKMIETASACLSPLIVLIKTANLSIFSVVKVVDYQAARNYDAVGCDKQTFLLPYCVYLN